eukprot:365949-Chlamydomonas_euryale.AAC.17
MHPAIGLPLPVASPPVSRTGQQPPAWPRRRRSGAEYPCKALPYVTLVLVDAQVRASHCRQR